MRWCKMGWPQSTSGGGVAWVQGVVGLGACLGGRVARVEGGAWLGACVRGCKLHGPVQRWRAGHRATWQVHSGWGASHGLANLDRRAMPTAPGGRSAAPGLTCCPCCAAGAQVAHRADCEGAGTRDRGADPGACPPREAEGEGQGRLPALARATRGSPGCTLVTMWLVQGSSQRQGAQQATRAEKGRPARPNLAYLPCPAYPTPLSPTPQDLLNKKEQIGDLFNNLRLARQRKLTEHSLAIVPPGVDLGGCLGVGQGGRGRAGGQQDRAGQRSACTTRTAAAWQPGRRACGWRQPASLYGAGDPLLHVLLATSHVPLPHAVLC